MVLRREHWKKKRAPRTLERPGLLTPEEQACVKIAIAVLRVRFGSLAKVAKAMRVHGQAVVRAAREGVHVETGMALAVARLAGVPIDDVLSGRFPEAGSCPMCGHKLG